MIDLIPPWLGLIPLGALAAYLAHKHWPRSAQTIYAERLTELYTDMRRRGLSDDEQRQEMTFRYAMARLRERASAAVLARPDDYLKIVSEICADEAKKLTAIDRTAGRRFTLAVKAAPLSDILYRDALAAVTKLPIPRETTPTSIDIAAVTTLRN